MIGVWAAGGRGVERRPEEKELYLMILGMTDKTSHDGNNLLT